MKTVIPFILFMCTAGYPAFTQSSGEINLDQRLTLITLGVSDLENSTEFYERNFGWKRTESSSDEITFFT